MISTKGRYALRVMVDLAQQGSERYVPLEEIAQRQGISKKYLEIVLKTLVREKLLKGLRGKGGGYRLTREPGQYTVWEVLELTEDSMAPVACLRCGTEPCVRADACATLPMWKQFDGIVREFFSGITVEALAKGEGGQWEEIGS